jgi:uncharacterized protein with predicted RNA binding PUA domain
MLDYEFGRGTASALPKDGLKFTYSRRSGRMKQVTHRGRLFATIRPNGAIAPTLYGASVLAKSKRYLSNAVVVRDEAVSFVKEGKSVFCKFVESAGKHVLPRGEVVVLDRTGEVIGVGKAKLRGDFMLSFNSGVAVKIRGTYSR